MKVKVTTVGSSAGVVLPKEVLAKLRVRKGDSLYLSETADGIELSPYDPDFDQETETGTRRDAPVSERAAQAGQVTWRWLSKRAVLAIHAEQLAEHGGAPGSVTRGCSTRSGPTAPTGCLCQPDAPN